MFEVVLYATPDGASPVGDWLDTLAERDVARILERLERVEAGNFGDHKPVGGGVWELRFRFGPGYRVYYARTGRRVVLLLHGGDKSTQKRDVKRAKAYRAEFEGRPRD